MIFFESWESDKSAKFLCWCESLGCILVSKDAKVSSNTYSVPFALAVLCFHLCLWDFFSRLLIRCLLSFIMLSLIFSYFTCKDNKHNINKLCFLTHSSPFPRPCNNSADFKLFWYSYLFGIHQKEFWQKEFVKKIKINIIISSSNTIINNKQLD